MINPEYKAHWRPTHDLGRRFEVAAIAETYTPSTVSDALAYVRELALPDISAYDGQACQQEMIEEKAKELFPDLYQQPLPTPEEVIETADDAVANFYAQHRYENGEINWSSVVKATSYVVSSTVMSAPTQSPLDEMALTA